MVSIFFLKRINQMIQTHGIKKQMWPKRDFQDILVSHGIKKQDYQIGKVVLLKVFRISQSINYNIYSFRQSFLEAANYALHADSFGLRPFTKVVSTSLCSTTILKVESIYRLRFNSISALYLAHFDDKYQRTQNMIN